MPQDWAGYPVFEEGVSWEHAQDALLTAELGDGLPQVAPTLTRLRAMVEGRDDLTAVHGHMQPLFGELRLDAVAYQCVLAGCHPEELPVVWSAAKACIEARFNLLGLLTTTGTPAVALVVHGGITERLTLNSSSNCLGPGNRANACIGRALSLVLFNIAGAKPGIGDMATMGQPGKYSFCFAEGRHPLVDSLAVRRGLASNGDAVTIIGVSGTAEVLPVGGAARAEDVLDPIALAMRTAPAISGAGRDREPGEQLFLLPPEMADRITGAGWDLSAVQQYLYDNSQLAAVGGDEQTREVAPRVAASPADIHPILTGGPGVKMTHIPSWSGGTWSITAPIEI